MENIKVEIGTKYQARNKRKDICKVIDIHRTYNSANELIGTSYLCEHEFLGQKIKHTECLTTIKLAIFYNGEVA